MNHFSPSIVWDEKHIKALLRLRRYPLRMIKIDPWHNWLERHGGIFENPALNAPAVKVNVHAVRAFFGDIDRNIIPFGVIDLFISGLEFPKP